MTIKLAAIMAVLTLGILSASAQPKNRSGKLDVKVDTTKIVNIQEWAANARKLAEEWYPRIGEILGAKLPEEGRSIKLVFEFSNGVAGTAGSEIHINADWVQKHPEDKGMVVHELTHVVQAYPKYDPVWLVEGIADYVRWWIYEVKPPRLPNPDRATYHDSYQTSAAFLAWVEKTYPGTIKKTNAALKSGTYQNSMYVQWTGKDLDALWADFSKAVKDGSFTAKRVEMKWPKTNEKPDKNDSNLKTW